MNSINFLSGDKFPMYREVLVKLQEQIQFLAQLSGIGGKNYILSGMEGNGQGYVNAGLIVIDGEVLPFVGGYVPADPSRAITIEETKTPVNAFGVTYPEVYTIRVAKFAAGGQYNFLELNNNRIRSNIELFNLINAIKGEPVGVVKMWAGMISQIPEDYILCDGRMLQISQYPALAQALGITYGSDSAGGFRIPDLRGRFVAGYKNDEADYDTQGKTGGAKEITLSIDQIPAHTHKVKADGASGSGEGDRHRVADWSVSSTDIKNSETIGGGQAHENRPPFFVLAYIIKVK